MLKSVKKIIDFFLNLLIPIRSDFNIVKNLDEKTIFSLPKAEKVYGMSWISPLFKYKDRRVKAIIWELKYRNNTLPLETIGKIIYEEIIAQISDIAMFDNDAKFIILPVPITNEKRATRGYNQSEYICRAIMENDTVHTLLYAPQWLQKTKDTPSQSRSQSREERIKNLEGCFWADENIAGKYIILIDDVVTTGSTLSETRKTLLQKGAINVIAFTIAH